MNITLLSVILPCFNEEGNLRRFPTELFPAFDQFSFRTEFVLVDDGSRDGTRAAAEELARGRSNVRVLSHGKNRGLGASLRTGFSAAAGDAILTMDSDLTFAANEAGALIAAYEPGIDCVAGSPLLGRFEGVPLYRRILSDGVNFMYRALMGRPLTSVSSIFRLYRAGTLRRLSLESEAFDINAEIIFKLLQAGAVIREIPSRLSVRTVGESKINTRREIVNHLRMFARILRWRALAKTDAGPRGA